MNAKDLKIGMKVVPHQKTAYAYFTCQGLECSTVWQRAIKNNQPYLYFIKTTFLGRSKVYVLSDNPRDDGGDYFNIEDFSPYCSTTQREIGF